MKLVYETPLSEIVYLDVKDIIQTSGIPLDPGNNDGEWIEM